MSKSMSDDWFNAIYWISLLLGIFIIKKYVVLSLTFLGTLKYNCAIKTIEILKFLPLINNQSLLDLVFYYQSYQKSYHQKLLILYVPCLGYILQYFNENLVYHLGIQ